MNNYVLISKDALCTDYLPTYGNRRWHTPNIDSLASKGTVFYNHYTAAPSTVMSFFSAITGLYGHETEYEMYERIHDVYVGETLFTKLKNKGYRCHIIWGDIWEKLPEYFDCYRNDVTIHRVDSFKQGVGAHYIHDGVLRPDDEKKQSTFETVEKLVKSILDAEEDVFIWIHFPHVINGEVSYGSDIELFDKYVGMIRRYVSDDNISITADHGNMNGHKGKTCYGFDVYQPEIKIPLITPMIKGNKECRVSTSSTDLYSLLFENEIPNREYVYSDTAYRGQANRKLAIIYDKYKYIYNKMSGTEELYDLDFDPTEEFSLIADTKYDTDRKIEVPSRELYYYPEWDKLPEIRERLRAEKNRIWKNGSAKITVKSKLKDLVRPLYAKIRKKRSKKN